MKKITMVLMVVIFVLACDQASKQWALIALNHGLEKSVLPVLQFRLAMNHGVAFSLFHTKGLESPWILMALTGGLSILVMGMIYQTPKNKTLDVIALSMILGGAIGNFIDRVRFGAVVDFIDAFVGIHHWPVFNIADSFICLGAFILILASFQVNSEKKK